LNALNLLDSDRNHNLPEWRFHYFGTDGKHVFSEAEHYGLINRVVLHGQVPREESLSAVAGADVSVVITSNKETGSLADNGVITSKIFEALGLGTRILLIAPKGSDAETIVKEAGAGGSFTGKQTEEIAKYFREIMVNGKSNLIPPTQHSWPEIALQLNALLRQIVKEHAKETANACIASNDQ